MLPSFFVYFHPKNKILRHYIERKQKVVLSEDRIQMAFDMGDDVKDYLPIDASYTTEKKNLSREDRNIY